MARNDALQNPDNKVGRNSGAGPDGVSRIARTAREAARGLEPLRTGGGTRRWVRPLGLGLGAIAAAGAGVAALAWKRSRRPRGLAARLASLVGRG